MPSAPVCSQLTRSQAIMLAKNTLTLPTISRRKQALSSTFAANPMKVHDINTDDEDDEEKYRDYECNENDADDNTDSCDDTYSGNDNNEDLLQELLDSD